MRSQSGTLMMGLVPLQEEIAQRLLSSYYVTHSEKSVTYKPRRELSPETDQASTLILDF